MSTTCPFCKKESECPQCDTLTAQVGMACEVNNELIAQRDELRYALNRLLDSQNGTALGVIHARDFARAILAKTAPENPNAGVVQASPRGRWTP